MTKQAPGIRYIQPSESFFEIPGVVYRGKTGTYRLFEKMTDSMTQEQLAEFYEKEKSKGNPHPMDSVLHFAIPSAAYRLRNESPEEAEKLRVFLQRGFEQAPNTLTRAIYNPSGDDEIIHNYGTSDQYFLRENIVGSDNWIADISDKNVLESLLGTKDVVKINEVSQWINRTNSYLWRLNSKSPTKKEERVARFGALSDRLVLDCDRDPLDEYPAFRVLRVK